jgi:hypothetical protein
LESIIDTHGKTVPIVQANIVPAQWSGEVLSALCLMVAGFLVVFVLDRMAGGDRSA